MYQPQTHPNQTKNDLQQRFSISLSKLDKDIKNGKLKYYKIGATAVRFTEEDIQEYITRH